MEPKSVAEQLAEARQRKRDREAAAQADRDAAELEKLQLEERFEKELSGKVGKDFAIVDCSDLGKGFVVVKLGLDVHWKTFKSSKMDEVDVDSFVSPNVVHPSKDEFRKLVHERPAVGDRCAVELSHLFGLKRKEDEGK